MKALITGSAGLVGSESARFFSKKGFDIIGIDNDMRKSFFGEDASTLWNRGLLQEEIPSYAHMDIDIRDKAEIDNIFKNNTFDIVIHAAAQPSHDWAASDPETDFTVNTNGTLVLLEAFRKYSPGAVFIFTSTNKVYGDTPNALPFIELQSRYELPEDHRFYKGIDETMAIDQSTHSLFGVSKASADLLVQEYGRYFKLKTVSFRGGCITGPAHSGAQLHGFLSYLIRCILAGEKYTINGYKGKQVRDNIDSYDLVNAFYHFYKNPKHGEVYNMGGARRSCISVLESVEKIEAITGKTANLEYKNTPRIGDHIWYISDISKFKRDYPDWESRHTIDDILRRMCEDIRGRTNV